MVADSHSVVARWRNYFSQLFNVHMVKDVGQAETHTAEPLVPEPSAFEVELVIVQEGGCGYIDWIALAQDRDRWRTLVSAVMNLRVP